MNLAGRIISSNFHTEQGMLVLGGNVPIKAVASEIGTPVFVYDAQILDRQWQTLRATFPSQFSIYYSVKANPSGAILQYLLAKGCGLEVASEGEFHQAIRAGCLPDNIVFAGPGKTESELETVIQHGIGEIHVESSTELDRIVKISQQLGKRTHIAVRVNPCREALGGAMRMGGKPAPFGIDEEQLDGIIDQIRAAGCLEFEGLHLFTGTQVLDHAVLMEQYRKGAEIARQVVEKIGSPLQTVDFGGGLGIPYFEKENELDCKALSNDLNLFIEDIRKDRRFANTRFMIEPGRFLVGPSGIYLTRVLDIKSSRGKKFVIVDGGMHHHLAASGNFGQVIKRNFPVVAVNRLHQDQSEVVDIVGPLCTPLDILARDIQVPPLEIGDLLGVLQSGAYARSASPLQFLSHPSPPEAFIQNGEIHLIRKKGTLNELWSDQIS